MNVKIYISRFGLSEFLVIIFVTSTIINNIFRLDFVPLCCCRNMSSPFKHSRFFPSYS